MYTAEVRARNGQVSPVLGDDMPSLQGDQLEPKPNIPLRAFNAFVPLLVLIGSLVGGLYVTGASDMITDIIGSADACKAMMWAALLGAVAIAAGTIPAGYGFPPLFSIIAGIGILLLVLRVVGRQADRASGPA